jgi:hypothetical protein
MTSLVFGPTKFSELIVLILKFNFLVLKVIVYNNHIFFHKNFELFFLFNNEYVMELPNFTHIFFCPMRTGLDFKSAPRTASKCEDLKSSPVRITDEVYPYLIYVRIEGFEEH